jgi:hypothetical protein
MKTIINTLILIYFIIPPFCVKAQDEYLIRNVTLISMENDTTIPHSDILISNERIKQIGKGLHVDSSKVIMINGINKYLMPGLADMHLHFWGDSTALRLYIANGVTTIKSMSGKPEYIQWRDQIKSKKKLGPQLYVSGPLMNDISFLQSFVPLPVKFIFFWSNILLFSIITYAILRIVFRKRIKKYPKRLLLELGLPLFIFLIAYGTGYWFIPIPQVAEEGEVYLFSRDWEVRKAVRQQVKIGYDAIKPYVSMTQSEFIAMMEEANEQNIPVVGHIPARVRIDDVIKYKMAGLAHVEELRYHFYKGYDFSGNAIPYDQIDTTGLDKIAKRLQKAAIFVTSSLVPCEEYIERQKDDSAFFCKPELKYVPLKTLALYKKEGFKTRDQYPEKEYWLLTMMLKSCHKNGVLIVLGTDSRWMNDVHGFAVHDELKLLVENGLSNYEALQASTKNAAISINAINEWGTIKEGKRADLLLLDKNPLENIHNTRAIAGVFLNGKWFDRIELDKILEKIQDYQKDNDREISANPKK